MFSLHREWDVPVVVLHEGHSAPPRPDGGGGDMSGGLFLFPAGADDDGRLLEPVLRGAERVSDRADRWITDTEAQGCFRWDGRWQAHRSRRGAARVAGGTGLAGIDEGVAAYKRGDYKLALQEWTPLAEQGHANAQYLIGEMYHEGVGVPQDNAAAAMWILRAAEQGHGDAQYLIGQMYHGGLGVPLDYAEAALWYRRAGEQGNPGCQFILGFLYSTGQGVPKDFVQAHFWFSVSAAQGSDASRKSRERVAKKMTPAQIAEAQRLAREWMEKRRGK